MNVILLSSLTKNIVRGSRKFAAVRSLHSGRRIHQKPQTIFSIMSPNKTNIITPFSVTDTRAELFWSRIKKIFGMDDPKEHLVKEEKEFEKKFACKYYYHLNI